MELVQIMLKMMLMMMTNSLFLQKRCLDGLKSMEHIEVNTEILAETKAGKHVKSLIKHGNEEISSAARRLVDTWKALVRREATSNAQGDATGNNAISPAINKETDKDSLNKPKSDTDTNITETTDKILHDQIPKPDSTSTEAQPEHDKKGTGLKDGELEPYLKTGDNVRDKVRLNLIKALVKAIEEGATGNPADVGTAIENSLLEMHKGVSAGYKAKFRQLHFNLKDDKNPDLRRRVLEGCLDVDTLLMLPPEELASDAKREENERIRKEKLFHSAPSAATQMTSDGMFQCFKCRKKKVTYYQMQTRSADEPMTTFLTCLNCGNKWKIC